MKHDVKQAINTDMNVPYCDA